MTIRKADAMNSEWRITAEQLVWHLGVVTGTVHRDQKIRHGLNTDGSA